MGEFFKPWRRKVGVLTLVMGLALMGAWIRSAFVEDSIEVPTGKHSTISLVSAYSQLLLKIEFRRSSDYTPLVPTWRSVELWDGIRWYDDPPAVFHWRWNGFAVAEVPYRELFDDDWQDYRSTYYFAPFWSFVVPLVMISIWLLFIIPRKSNQPKIHEPISNFET